MPLTLNELNVLVAGGESERVEFKKSTGQRTDAAKTICAMLNGSGGCVLFGVTDRREIVGQLIGENTLQDIVTELRRIDPPVIPSVETLFLGKDRAVIRIRVTGGVDVYTYDGRAFLRQGNITSLMPRRQYEKLLLERVHPAQRWENLPAVDGIGLDDLDRETIQRVVDTASRLGRMEPLADRNEQNILMGLGLLDKGRLLNAAVVLFAQNATLRIHYPQCGIRLARFRGADRLADFSDNRQFWGNLFELLKRGESFLMDHVPIPGRIVPGRMVREDRPWYPSRATREALANALCHRDYSEAGGNVAVAMYDDRLEITNPGLLHFGLSVQDLAGPHPSKPWNPLIAGVLYRAGIIEQWGSGTLNILQWCRTNGCPPPEWSEDRNIGEVSITLRPPAEFILPPVHPHHTATVLPGTSGSLGQQNTMPAIAGAAPEVTADTTAQATAEVTAEATAQAAAEVTVDASRAITEEVAVGITAIVAEEIFRYCQQPRRAREIMSSLNLRHWQHFQSKYLRPLLKAGWLVRTIPEKPNSPLQRYTLSTRGRQWLEKSLGRRG